MPHTRNVCDTGTLTVCLSLFLFLSSLAVDRVYVLQVLVVLRRDQPTLVKTLQSAVSMDGTVIKVLAAGNMCW